MLLSVLWREAAERARKDGGQVTKVEMALLNSVVYLAERGFHASTIARITGLTKEQVYYRTSRLGVSLRSYRDGRTKAAQQFIQMTPTVRMHIVARKGERYAVKQRASHA